jgi:phosphoglycerate dehydrogenase-like enzyme
MSTSKKIRLLLNFPESFYANPLFKSHFQRLAKQAIVRKRTWKTPQEIAADLAWSEAVIMWWFPTLDDDLLAQAKRLKFIGHINNIRSMAEAELRRGLAISEARRGFSPAVAEMALTLMLAGLRQTSRHHIAMRQGTESWCQYPHERQLAGRSVGIVGFGGIGQSLAELLKPFQCTIRTFDPFLPPPVAAKFGARMVPLMELIRKSEVVVLCAANSREAAHLMGAKQIAALQKHAVLVNVGRSMLVDMPALAERLKRGDLIAMLDVFDREPLEEDSIFRTLPNTYLTPHRAGGIPESYARILTMLADDFEAWAKGKARKHALTEKDLTSIAG